MRIICKNYSEEVNSSIHYLTELGVDSSRIYIDYDDSVGSPVVDIGVSTIPLKDYLNIVKEFSYDCLPLTDEERNNND